MQDEKKLAISYAQQIAAVAESPGGEEIVKAIRRQRRYYREMAERIDLTNEYRMSCINRAGGLSEVLSFLKTGSVFAANAQEYLPKEGQREDW